MRLAFSVNLTAAASRVGGLRFAYSVNLTAAVSRGAA